MTIIDRLENYRLENRISQQELAKKLEVAFSTVNRWLNGKVKPNKIQSYHIENLLKEGAKNSKKDIARRHKRHNKVFYKI